MGKLYKFGFRELDSKLIWNELLTDEELENGRFTDVCKMYEEDGCELVGQGQEYIGINDSNNEMIFEGDKVKFKNYKNGAIELGVVKFSRGSFYIDTDVLKIYNIKKLQDLIRIGGGI